MFSFCSKVPSECRKCHFRDTNFKHFPREDCPRTPSLDAPYVVRVPRLGAANIRLSPRVVNRLATPVLIVNTPIVISSKREVLPHFHTRKHVIFAWFYWVSSVHFGTNTPQSKCPRYATDFIKWNVSKINWFYVLFVSVLSYLKVSCPRDISAELLFLDRCRSAFRVTVIESMNGRPSVGVFMKVYTSFYAHLPTSTP